MTNYFEVREAQWLQPPPEPLVEAVPVEAVTLYDVLDDRETEIAEDFLDYMEARDFPYARVIRDPQNSFAARGYPLGYNLDYHPGYVWGRPYEWPTHFRIPQASLDGVVHLSEEKITDKSDTTEARAICASLYRYAEQKRVYLCEDESVRYRDGSLVPKYGVAIDLTLPPRASFGSTRELVDVGHTESYMKDIPTVDLHAKPATFVKVLEYHARRALGQ